MLIGLIRTGGTMKSINWALVLLVVTLLPACVSYESQERPRRHRVVPEYDTTPEARGCYWYRERRYCSRYCYVEVDGRRFCRERQREAFPQAEDASHGSHSGERTEDNESTHHPRH